MKKVYLILLFIFYSCAVQGPISGGPVDSTPPELLNIIPENFSTGISDTQDITIVFDETIDPDFTEQSVKINNNKFTVKVKGRSITISPESKWIKSSLLNIYIDRNVQDYQKNRIDSPIDLYYSFTDYMPNSTISGSIIDIDNTIDKLNSMNSALVDYEVGLYKIYEMDTLLIKTVNSDENLGFNFSVLEPGRYSVVAVEDKISDIREDLYKKKYSILNHDIILIENDNQVATLNISEPIPNNSIVSIVFNNPYFVNYILSDGTVHQNIIESVMSNPYGYSRDSLSIKLQLENQFYSYYSPEFNFFIPEMIDSVSPFIRAYEMNEESNILKVNFSEPIQISSKDSLFYYISDSVQVFLNHIPDLNQNSLINRSMNLSFSGLLDNNMIDIMIENNRVSDYYNNVLKDTLLFYSKDASNTELSVKKYGRILGNVKGYSDTMRYTVVAYNTQNKDSHKVFVDKDNNFIFDSLVEGSYLLQSYESYDSSIPKEYYAGEWLESKPSKNFSQIVGPIEVRGNWDIEDIVINIIK